jgi:hypothetical protein
MIGDEKIKTIAKKSGTFFNVILKMFFVTEIIPILFSLKSPPDWS